MADLYLNEPTMPKSWQPYRSYKDRVETELGAGGYAPFYESGDTEPVSGQKEFVWRTRDGRQIPVTEMTDEHLRNAISWAQRRLVHELGTSRWLSSTKLLARAFYEFVREAEQRGMSV